MADFDNFTVKQSDYPVYDEDKKKEVLGRLEALKDLATYIDVIRESYTRELVVNGVNPQSEQTEDAEQSEQSDQSDQSDATL